MWIVFGPGIDCQRAKYFRVSAFEQKGLEAKGGDALDAQLLGALQLFERCGPLSGLNEHAPKEESGLAVPRLELKHVLEGEGCSGDIWRRDYTLRNWAVDPPKKEEQMQ